MFFPRPLGVLAALVTIAALGCAQGSMGPGTATFFDISTTGTALTGAGDDTAHGFTSSIGNDLFPAGPVAVSTNGFAVALALPSMSNLAVLPITSATTGLNFGYAPACKVLAPWWDDLNAAGVPNGTLYWREVNNILYIQWHNIGHYPGVGGPGQPAIRFQIQIVQQTCGLSTIHMVYPDAVFGGAQASSDLAATACVGYVGGNTGHNAQWSYYLAGAIQNGTSLTITYSGLSVGWSSPSGPGSLLITPCGGSPNGAYQLFATVNQGLFPNGWFFGLDMTYPEVLSEFNVFPFKGPLNGAGAATIGPFTGLPSGLPIYSVVFNIPPGSVPTTHSLPFVYFIP